MSTIQFFRSLFSASRILLPASRILLPASRILLPVSRILLPDSRILLPAIYILLPFTLNAQEHTFIPERPGQTWSTEVAAPGFVHFEAGVLMQRAAYSREAGDGELAGGEVYRHTIWQLPAMMLRIGFGDHVEFRLGAKYQRMSWRYDEGYFGSTATANGKFVEDGQGGITVLNAGIKTLLAEERGWIPRAAFIASVSIPGLGSPHFDIEQPAPDLALSFSHTLARDLYLGYSGGLAWDGFTSVPMGYASTMLAMDVDERMCLFAEYGVEVNAHAPVLHSVDAGLILAFNDDLKFDAWAGFGIGDPEVSSSSPHYTSIYRPDVFVGAGAAYRIKL